MPKTSKVRLGIWHSFELKTVFALLKATAQGWSDDSVSTLSGSLAYSTIFSIAPLLIIAIGIVGFVFGSQSSSGAIFSSIQGLLGPEASKAIQGMVEAAAKKPESGLVATIAGIVISLVGASSVFQQIQQSLNFIWKVRAKPRSGLSHFLKQRLLSFSMILVIAFLLLVSLVLSTGLSVVGNLMGDVLPGGMALWHIFNIVISFVIISGLFAAIFKILPDVKLAWHDVWVGAAVTSLLFTLGKTLIGIYLGHSSVASAYGAAGSFVVVLLWVYYSSAIMFFGAEFTRIYVTRNGKQVSPTDDSELISIQTLRT